MSNIKYPAPLGLYSCLLLLFASSIPAQTDAFQFCPAGVQPEGFVDWSKLPVPPVSMTAWNFLRRSDAHLGWRMSPCLSSAGVRHQCNWPEFRNSARPTWRSLKRLTNTSYWLHRSWNYASDRLDIRRGRWKRPYFVSV
jgi:hypothetical protein